MLLFLLACAPGIDTAAPDATWYQDVKPIVEASCAGCHEEGGIAPFPLTTYEEVSALSLAVAGAVGDRSMPPWGADSSLQAYLDDRSLSEAQLDTVLGWIDAGMPEGDPSDPAAAPPVEWPTLARVDATVAMDAAYAPDFSASPDSYRCFVLDWPAATERYVTGIDVHPGNTAIVHHVIAFIATPEEVEHYAALDAADSGDGYSCYGGTGGEEQAAWLGGWVPGKAASLLPEDTGIAIAPGSQVILQVHYNDSGEPGASAQTAIDFQLEDSVSWPGGIQPFTDVEWVNSGEMVIPARSEGTRYTYEMAIPVDLRMYSGGMHMHTRARSGELWVERADGTIEWLLSVPSWDFSWQQSYWLAEPIDFNAGDTLGVACTWDNPGDEDITWGEGTDDEMCLGLIYMTSR